jgi:hypothetical protein
MLSNPLTLAIVGGIIAALTTVVGSQISDDRKAILDREDDKRQLEADLIKEFTKSSDQNISRVNLKFLADAGLIPDYKEAIESYLVKNPDEGPIGSVLSGAIAISPNATEAYVAGKHIKRENVLAQTATQFVSLCEDGYHAISGKCQSGKDNVALSTFGPIQTYGDNRLGWECNWVLHPGTDTTVQAFCTDR